MHLPEADRWDDAYLSIEDSRWHEALNTGLPMAQQVWRCNHCWHLPRDWHQGTSQIPPPRLCCWCGGTEGPHHGPYAPEGDR
jgi:hypothetical protein